MGAGTAVLNYSAVGSSASSAAFAASKASAWGRPWSTMAIMVMFTSANGSLPNNIRMWLTSSTENSSLIMINVQYIKQNWVVAYKLQPPLQLDREVCSGRSTATQTLAIFQLLQVAQATSDALRAVLVVRVECQ